jgi:hypothetical protein
MFDQDINFDLDQFDLMGGMDLNAAAAGPAKSKSTTTTTEQQARSGATTPASSELAGVALQQQDPTLLAPDADPFALSDTEFDQGVHHPMFDQDFAQPLGEMGRGLQGTAPAASESEGGRQAAEQEDEDAATGEYGVRLQLNAADAQDLFICT